jgi:hypothetical protein
MIGDWHRGLDESTRGCWITLRRPIRKPFAFAASGVQADNSLFQSRSGSPYELGRSVVVNLYSHNSVGIPSSGARDRTAFYPAAAVQQRSNGRRTNKPQKNLHFSRHEPIVGSLRAACANWRLCPP